MEAKICTRCGSEKTFEEFSKAKAALDGRTSHCKVCRAAAERKRRKETDRDYLWRQRWLKKKYGITPDDFDQMFEKQAGLCQICGTDRPGGRWNTFCVDHCHKTGKVRGLLCKDCNTGIGQMGDSPSRLRLAADYLEKYGG